MTVTRAGTGTATAFRVPEGASVLVTLAGTGRSAIDVGCRRGGCGTCRVQVSAGQYRLGKMSAAEISPAERAAGVVLACQIFPESDLELIPLGRRGHSGPPGVEDSADLPRRSERGP